MIPMYIFPAFHFPVSEAAVSSAVLGHYIPSELGNDGVREVCKLVKKGLLQPDAVCARETTTMSGASQMLHWIGCTEQR